MLLSSFTRRHWVKLGLLASLPLALYFMLAARMSWRPRILLSEKTGYIGNLVWRADSRALVVLTQSESHRDHLKLFDTVSLSALGDLDANKSLADRTRLAPNDLFTLYYGERIILPRLPKEQSLKLFRTDCGPFGAIYNGHKLIGVSRGENWSHLAKEWNHLKCACRRY